MKTSAAAVLIAAAVQSCAGQPRADGMPPSGPQPGSGVQRGLPSAIERRVDSLLALMTLEERAGQLNQLSAEEDTLAPGQLDPAQVAAVRAGLVGSMLNVRGAAAARAIQEIALKSSRLGIPLLFGLDVVHGYRTITPIPLAEACSWDPALVERSARMAAEEAASAGVHWTFAPMVDIARDPRWGRIAEGSGEDPHLGSVMAAARVRGFQGAGLASPSALLACAKHFAAYGAAEGGRDYNTADISRRTLREVYLPPFKAAVDAGALSLMSSFNEIGGVPSSGNRELLTDILRGEWGFLGLVVSDWGAVGELMVHGVAGSRAEAAALGLSAGVDMDMESRCFVEELPRLVRAGAIPESTLAAAARRILRLKFALGLFDNPHRSSSPERERAALLTAEHRALAREVAARSIVLLKNDGGLLPLGPSYRTIALVGPLADDTTSPLGCWHARGRPGDVVSLAEGVRSAVPPGTRILVARGCEFEGGSPGGIAAAESVARQADVVILAVGESLRMSGEASCRSSLDLPGRQEDLARRIHATGRPVVMVLMNGRPLSIPWAAGHVPAIVEAWFAGVEAGNAIADVLFGRVNPGGKLCATFPRSVGQVPIYYNHRNTGRPPSDREHYTSKYLDLPSTPLYSFGHGLSYTTFSVGPPRVDRPVVKAGDTVRVVVEVRNTGGREGDEVVQLYLRKEPASVTRAVKELKAFRRVTLAPGASRRLEFALGPDEMAMYAADMRRVVEEGRYRVMVGPSSADLREATFEVRGR